MYNSFGGLHYACFYDQPTIVKLILDRLTALGKEDVKEKVLLSQVTEQVVIEAPGIGLN